jgi:tripartite-type tricarboxylate transporter receptor subunit TctC
VLFAPAKTPTPVMTRLNQETVKVLNSTDVKEKFLGMGVEVVGDTSQDASTRIHDETVTWAKVIKDAGVKVE